MPVHILSPQLRHIEGLIRLSGEFATEFEWASAIPIGQISTPEIASSKLFGPDVIVALVAEARDGEMAGYAGVYAHPGGAYISFLVGASCRRSGLAKRLVEETFGQLPAGLAVEAWVGAFNRASLAATPRLGFQLNRIIEDGGHRVHVFARQA